MKKSNSGVGDPQPRLGVQEFFLHIGESPAPRGMAWQPLLHVIPPFMFENEQMHNVGPRCTRPVVALRKKGECLALLTIFLAFAMLLPPTFSQNGKKDKFPHVCEFQNSMHKLEKKLTPIITNHLYHIPITSYPTGRSTNITHSHHHSSQYRVARSPPSYCQKIRFEPPTPSSITHPTF